MTPTRTVPLQVVGLVSCLAVIQACRVDGTRPLVAEDDSVTALAVGFVHTCALRANGVAYCWGSNAAGQLGTGQSSDLPQQSPAIIVGLAGVRAIAAGYAHTCALDQLGRAWCWGLNSDGQLGIASSPETCHFQGADTLCSTSPRQVAGGLEFTQVTAGGYHSCGIGPGGRVYCWGVNRAGQLGTGPDTASRAWIPTPVASQDTFLTLSAGYTSTCGTTVSGKVVCWGGNSHGQLGIPVDAVWRHPMPSAVVAPSAIAAVSASAYHTCGLDNTARAFCWGANYYGQLGASAAGQACRGLPCSSEPLQVTGVPPLAAVATGNEHSCGLAIDGTAWCWGQNFWGNLGNGGSDSGSASAFHATPSLVLGTQQWHAIAGGFSHTCAITATRTLYCWGGNEQGQLGVEAAHSTRVPTRVSFEPR